MFTNNVPKIFWGEAILTTSYLTKRLPSKAIQYKTPIQLFLHQFPHYCCMSDLPVKTFGCSVFDHSSQPNQNKLDSQAAKCIFLSYSPNPKGYKCYNPQTKKMVVSRDVTFLENLPYYSKFVL